MHDSNDLPISPTVFTYQSPQKILHNQQGAGCWLYPKTHQIQFFPLESTLLLSHLSQQMQFAISPHFHNFFPQGTQIHHLGPLSQIPCQHVLPNCSLGSFLPQRRDFERSRIISAVIRQIFINHARLRKS
jgi:hypothetical protein